MSLSGSLAERIEEITGRPVRGEVDVRTDTTQFMNIWRGQVVRLGDRHYLIRGDMREGRFGLDDEPKLWVKRAIDLDTGEVKILKLVFAEEFRIRIGLLGIRCYRSARKEGAVLDRVRGDERFMQGGIVPDERGNEVRVIDFIPGPSLYRYLQQITLDHRTYFETVFPGLLRRFVDAVEGIGMLHESGLCHGDIRADHLIVERETGRLRWIDFDLSQDVSDFDVWSLGNVLLHLVGKGEHTFHELRAGRLKPADPGVVLGKEDASAFFVHRIMNLGKLFPWIPGELNEILMRFSFGTTEFYEEVGELTADLRRVQEMLDRAGGTG